MYYFEGDIFAIHASVILYSMYGISIRQCSRIFSCDEISALLAISLLILFQLRSGDIDLHYQIFEFDIIFR